MTVAPRPGADPPTYRPGEVNRCPNCAASNWLVGRQSAECTVCDTVAIIKIPSTPTILGD